MFWNDIKEIKETLNEIKLSLYYHQSKPTGTRKLEGVITEEHEEEISHLENVEHSLSIIKESLDDIFAFDNSDSVLQRLHDKLNILLVDEKRNEAVNLATKTLDKFDDYMKNVDKLNLMVNEFKGLVSIARAALNEKKEFEKLLQDIRVVADRDRDLRDQIKKNTEFALSLHNQQFKIDALYKELIENKLLKKKVVRKKKVNL